MRDVSVRSMHCSTAILYTVYRRYARNISDSLARTLLILPEDPDLIYPVANIADIWGRNNTQWFAIGRLHVRVTPAQAQSEIQSITSNLAKEIPDTRNLVIRLSPLDAETTSHVRPALLLMLGISIVLLLIACTNIMNLLFSRAATRAREMAIRKAVGASTWRLVRQMLNESAFLTLLGGILGVALAWSVLDFLVRPVACALTDFRTRTTRSYCFVLRISRLRCLLSCRRTRSCASHQSSTRRFVGRLWHARLGRPPARKRTAHAYGHAGGARLSVPHRSRSATKSVVIQFRRSRISLSGCFRFRTRRS